jgi:hypothetical protein
VPLPALHFPAGQRLGCTSASCCSWTRSLSSINSSSSNNGQHAGGFRPSLWGLFGVTAAAGGVALSSSAFADARTKELKAAAAASKPAAQAALQQQPKGKHGLPEFTAEEVAQHRTPKDRVWVTYKDGVYDVTDFVAQVRHMSMDSNDCQLPLLLLATAMCSVVCGVMMSMWHAVSVQRQNTQVTCFCVAAANMCLQCSTLVGQPRSCWQVRDNVSQNADVCLQSANSTRSVCGQAAG